MANKRIQKLLSEQGVCSRRQAEAFIEAGDVSVNGVVVTNPATRVDDETAVVTLSDHAKKILGQRRYIKYYKPQGIVTHSPQEGETSIQDIIDPTYKQLAPIGRLDKDSEGLILLSDDGIFAKSCLQHDTPHEREYIVTVSKPLTSDMIEQCEQGMMLQGHFTKPCSVVAMNPRVYRFIMTEGRNRQIRRMIQKVGSSVKRLKRVRFGVILLDDLQPNEFRVFKPI